jgi:hypothetical protein
MAVKVEAVGIVELKRIAIRRTNHGKHEALGRNHLTVYLDVTFSHPVDPLQRRAKPQHFLDGDRKQSWRVLKAGELV